MAKKVVLKISPKSGDPVNPKRLGDAVIPEGRTRIEGDFDLRDRLSELAIMGNALSSDNKAAIYSSLRGQLGDARAQKLMNHAYIFNSRPDVQRLSPEEKIKSFYEIGSSDPEVMEVMGRTKKLGYGVLPGFRESISALNQASQGRASTTVDPEAARRVLLRVNK